MIGEFDLIKRYFAPLGKDQVAESVLMGIGDDAAVISPRPGKELVVASDTLVAGVHFPQNANPALIARRSLRVNLSDMAAMGAKPCWFTLALTIPEANEKWLAPFASGLAQDAQCYGCQLVGGDTTRGPLAITLTLIGEVEPGKALLRSGAKPGDSVFVSGELGSAAAALDLLDKPEDELADWQKILRERYYLPEPCLELGRSLVDIATAAIDISDGMLADAGHIAQSSCVRIALNSEKLPTLPSLQQFYSPNVVQKWQLIGGDDYQLCFTVPANKLKQLDAVQKKLSCRITQVGEVLESDTEGQVICLDANGIPMQIEKTGYTHFQNE